MGIRVEAFGFRVEGLGLMAQDLRFEGLRVEGVHVGGLEKGEG